MTEQNIDRILALRKRIPKDEGTVARLKSELKLLTDSCDHRHPDRRSSVVLTTGPNSRRHCTICNKHL